MARSIEEYAKANPKHHSGRCWATYLKEDIQEALDDAASKGFRPSMIYEWLRDEFKVETTEAKVRRHVEGRCRCA